MTPPWPNSARVTRRRLLLGGAAFTAAACLGISGCALLWPPPFSDAVMAYDEARKQVVLFGSIDQEGQIPETWTWDGRLWTLQHPSGSGVAAPGESAAYDGATQQVVVFGGWYDASSGGHSGQLWGTSLWDGHNWTDGPDLTDGEGAGWAAMAYDAARAEVIRFGGTTVSYSGGGTGMWTLADNKWTWQSPPTSPPGRTQASMSYDAARQQIVPFGGYDGTNYLGDTWVWDGSNWTQQQPSVSPPPRAGAGMAYDAARQVTVLFGGVAGASMVLGDMWAWDSRTWSQLQIKGGPSPRVPAGMVYDDARRQIVLFGGDTNPNSNASHYQGDTRTWDVKRWQGR